MWIPAAARLRREAHAPGRACRRARLRHRAARHSIANRARSAGCAKVRACSRRPFQSACASASTSTRAFTRRSETKSATTSEFRCIVAGAATLLGLVPLATLGGVTVTLAEVVAGAIIVFYLASARLLGLLTGALLAALVALGRALPLLGRAFDFRRGLGAPVRRACRVRAPFACVPPEPPAPSRRPGLDRGARAETARRRASALGYRSPRAIRRARDPGLSGERHAAFGRSPATRRTHGERLERGTRAEARRERRSTLERHRRGRGARRRARPAGRAARRDRPRARIATTHENAVKTARILLAEGHRSVGVVTCDWHLRRALYCFRRAGFDAVGLGAPSPPVSSQRQLLRTLREQGAWLYDRAVARGW